MALRPSTQAAAALEAIESCLDAALQIGNEELSADSDRGAALLAAAETLALPVRVKCFRLHSESPVAGSISLVSPGPLYSIREHVVLTSDRQ